MYLGVAMIGHLIYVFPYSMSKGRNINKTDRQISCNLKNNGIKFTSKKSK